ncbi:unnamed protein product [Rhodiola kirilowii]
MNIAALLTSAGINIGMCVLLLSLYSILRKQPTNYDVYFARRIAQVQGDQRHDPFCFERFVPSASWLVKAWETTEDELLGDAGLDALVFIRIIVFSIRIFAIAAVVGIFMVLPLNYYGQEMQHKEIPSESLGVFTISNVMGGSQWFWAHVVALYIITGSACLLLYFENKSLSSMRLGHITQSHTNPSHFAVLVRSIPWSSKESYSDTVRNYFTKYYASSYLSHQMVHLCGTVRKLVSSATKIYKVIISTSIEQGSKPILRCGLCGTTTSSFKILSSEESTKPTGGFKSMESGSRENDCSAAFVFFRNRYSAYIASKVLQSTNPMLWVTDLAPEPHDVYWSNLCIPYRQLWFRRIATLIATVVFMFVFLGPVAFVQGLTELDHLTKMFPFLRGLLKRPYINRVVTGYLPSVVLLLFLYAVPPVMMLLAELEGSISRSGRKKSACTKVLYFTIWNVFFVNVFSGTYLKQLDSLFVIKDIPGQLGQAVPASASFFMTYVFTSGWTSLAVEMMQPFVLIYNNFLRYVLQKDPPASDVMSFPYHTELPRVLLFGLIGFCCAVLAPLILPFLLIYFSIAFLVYKNQFINVYVTKYDTGGQFWPIAHNATIFSLVLAQIIAMGVFGLKESTLALGCTMPLLICTLLFNEYCRQRFYPVFNNRAAEVLMEMDWQDEQSGRVDEIHRQLHSAYCQFTLVSDDFCKAGHSVRDQAVGGGGGGESVQDPHNIVVHLDSYDQHNA